MMYMISYDIEKNSLRTKLFKKLSNYGRNIQLSCFEVDMNETGLNNFMSKFEKKLGKYDKIYVYPLGNWTQSMTIRLGLEEKLKGVISI